MDAYINNKLLRLLFVPLTVIIASFYFFPFEFSFAVGANTKMVMAGVGIFLFLCQMVIRRTELNKDLLWVSLWALIVSVCGLFSVLYNRTNDMTYATYIVSMLVWLSAANVVVSFIRGVHGYVSVELICKYLVAVCVFQCVSALLIDRYELIRDMVNTYVAKFASTVSSGNSLDDAGRLYGIGAALDIAGSRFAVVLIMIAYCVIDRDRSYKEIFLLLLCFGFILVVGCMISRTTFVGAALSMFYWMIFWVKFGAVKRKVLFSIIGLFVVSIPIIIYLYNNNVDFHYNFRFAFEGFFNWVENGEWRTASTDTLKSMYIFPEEIKTWLIGDGYFADPIKTDPYYTGVSLTAFYKGIDVGYLRFIYYFGLVGLFAFIIYFCKAASNCINYFPAYKMMFLLILSVNFIVWLKVSTDIFLVFAPFLCISKEENDAYMERLSLRCE